MEYCFSDMSLQVLVVLPLYTGIISQCHPIDNGDTIVNEMILIGTEARERQSETDRDENKRERKEDRKAGREEQKRRAKYGKGELEQEADHNEEG